MRALGVSRDIEDLPGRVVHAAEEHHGEIVTMLVDHLVELVGPDGVLAGPGPDDDQVAFRVETVMAEL